MSITTQEKVDLLWKYFVHRTDTFAEQWYDPHRGGGYARQKRGACEHKPPCRVKKIDCPDITYIPLTKNDIIAHLMGTKTVGTYAHEQDDTVKWLCLDIDIRKGETGDVQKMTLDVASIIVEHFPRDCFRVEFSGNRGYHIWMFFETPILGAKAHTLGMWIRSQAPVDPAVGIEIYPKQQMITRVGNPVKIPLGIHRKTDNRCLFVRGTFEPYEDQWEALQTIVSLPEEAIDSFLKTHKVRIAEPEPRENPNASMTCMTRIMEEGLDEGIRDVGFFRLALFLKDRGLSHGATFAVLNTVNDKCDPPFDQIEEKLESAFDGEYSVFPCYDPAFDSYCSSSCRYFPKKARDRGHNNPEIIKQLSRD